MTQVLQKSWYGIAIISCSLLMITMSVNLELTLLQSMVGPDNTGLISAAAFSSYVIGLIPTLILGAGLSDRYGRVPVLILGSIIIFLSIFSLIILPDILTVILSRASRGVAVGMALGASAAFLMNSMSSKSAAANLHGVLVTLGLGGGALLTSLSPRLVGSNVPATLYGMLLWAGVCIVMLITIKEGESKVHGTMVNKPYISFSAWDAYLGIFIAWSMVGVMITMVSRVVPAGSSGVGLGVLVFLAVGTGAFIQPFCRGRSAAWISILGWMLLIFSFFLLTFGLSANSAILLLVAAGFCGLSSLGLIYLGGLERVLQNPGESEARAVSGYFLCGYIGLGGPCIFAGFLADSIGEIRAVYGFGALMFCVAIVVMIAAAFGLFRTVEVPSDRSLVAE